MKRRSNAGFTLAETLMTVLIVMLASLIMANIVPEALRLYDRVVTASNARLLMSTTISVLRDEMATARDVTLDLDSAGGAGSTVYTSITYTSMDRGAQCKIYLENPSTAEGETPSPLRDIYIQEYMDIDPVTNKPIYGTWDDANKVPVYDTKPRLLVSHETGERNGLRVTFDSIELANGIITFKGLAVYRASDTNKLDPVPLGMTAETGSKADTINLRVRMIMPPQAEPETPGDSGGTSGEGNKGGE